jgi:hypothetical protein
MCISAGDEQPAPPGSTPLTVLGRDRTRARGRAEEHRGRRGNTADFVSHHQFSGECVGTAPLALPTEGESVYVAILGAYSAGVGILALRRTRVRSPRTEGRPVWAKQIRDFASSGSTQKRRL